MGIPAAVSALLLLQAQNPTALCARSSSRLAPAADLYCIDLVPAPDFPQAAGAVELRRVPTPFGIAVTPDGRPTWDLRITVSGLDSTAIYMAWVTTPTFDHALSLGRIRNGRINVRDRVSLNAFVVIVSAERSETVTRREGRIVLRGMSAANVMRPYDFTALPPRHPPAAHAHEGGGGGWPMPPMHPAVPTMIPGLEALRPDVTPFVPGTGVDLSRIPRARPRQVMTVSDGDSIALHAMLVRRSVAGRDFVAYGFNAQWPGPLIRVDRAATIVVKFMNRLDQPTTVHWHGIRLDNRSDGVPHVTQAPVRPGGSFRYVVHFPDAGIYWYHPHHREDIQQDLGLYGNLLVQSPDPAFFGPAHRDAVLMLDDFLVADSAPVPHGTEAPTHALMGRFGNVFLVNGEPAYRLAVKRGEVVRFYLTNAANTRVFNVSIDGARLKLVGGDVGKLEREQWVESVVLAPAERWIVDARFERPGEATIVNRVQAIDHGRGAFFAEVDTLGVVAVGESAAEPDLGSFFDVLRTNHDVMREIDRYRPAFDGAAKELVLTLRADSLPFGLVQVMRLDTGFVNPVEWSGTMPMMDWLSTGRDVQWLLREPATGRENMHIDWTFRRGDVVRLRIGNDRHTLHPMAHPIHIHGQRFLVLAQNGVPSENLVWKDTFLLPVGWTADLLVEMSNPGRWMLHCHIAEHLETGMHMVFTVLPN
ncbi:MAG: multicopper oxidase family protein [Gemmatimonadales bacterium]|nr:multicopper oxidase family protein [Gemmatimonadales bacterium]